MVDQPLVLLCMRLMSDNRDSCLEIDKYRIYITCENIQCVDNSKLLLPYDITLFCLLHSVKFLVRESIICKSQVCILRVLLRKMKS